MRFPSFVQPTVAVVLAVVGHSSPPLWAQTPEPPMNRIKASYPYAGHRALEVSADNHLVFVAEGAAIGILDATALNQNIVSVIERVEVPSCAPMALQYYHHPSGGKDWLFIAGGSQGLWRLDLCSSLFNSPPSSCGTSTYNPVQLDISATSGFQHKVCIDVAVVEGNVAAGGDPLLCAIFAARRDADPAVGPSEARFYRLKADGTTPAYGTPISLVSATTPANSIAYAVASDPGDPNSVYVSTGTGWLYRINITSSSFTLAPVPMDPAILPCSGGSCPNGERMRDISVVKTEHYGSFLYAALDYGRIVEVRLPTVSGGGYVSRQTQIDHGFSDRIAAVTDGHDNIVVAVANDSLPSISSDSWVINRALGVWFDKCLSWVASDTNPGLPPGENKIRYFKRDASVTTPAAPASLLTALGDQTNDSPYWGTLVLRRLTSTRFASYEADIEGTTIRRLAISFTAPSLVVQAVIPYAGQVRMGSGEGIVTTINQGLACFGGEAGVAGPTFISDSPRDISIIPGTDGLCSGPTGAPCTGCGSAGPPNPYYGSLLGHAHWPDLDNAHEWQMSPLAHAWEQHTLPGCVNPGSCYQDPCQATICWQSPLIPNTTIKKSAWKLVRFQAAGINSSSTGPNLDMRWWQVYWDDTQQPAGGLASTPYHTSMADLRTDPATGFPLLIHNTRGAAVNGYFIMDGRDVAAQMQASMATCGPNAGRGEILTPQTISALSHPEFGPTETCLYGDSCNNMNPGPHNLLTNKCDEFTIDAGPAGIRYIVAIAAGFVATDSSSCSWSAYQNQPLMVLYDVTDVANVPVGQPLQPPVLLRTAVGGPGLCSTCSSCSLCTTEGNAWCVRTKVALVNGLPRTYAYVGDITAKILVYDVSYDQLYFAGSTPLTPIACLCLPVNPWDNQRDNLIDMELDGSYAYCALGRGGVGIINILNPYQPVIRDIVDTPGTVEGVVMRRDPLGHHQVLAGDMNGGMHLFGRANE